ncbi:hypothetical protein [Petrotoga sp. 9PWA.NaAc.5.4]|uniref:hypothetical protein n=1 Tax=Petrotoga sp. 9PWA.NaAc.5.4 TaxID=1434328 RepID=UPI000CADA3F7|nr:hypothetical protein [Petrotoga sp. 9PWA.NaAc.5.4]PNR96851.1 hypothetical protein X924_02450 [Petrotoga sp. 9PWA.NaAc.5.4]
MERIDLEKSQGLERSKSKVKVINIALIILVFLVFLTVSVWLTIFMNFGKNIENYKSIISKSQMEIKSLEEHLNTMDNQIDKYLEILDIME